MTDIFCGLIDFVQGTFEELPSIQQNLGTLGQGIDFLGIVYQFVSSGNFLVPVPDIFLILSGIFVLKVTKTLIFVANWVVRRIFDIIP